MSNQCLFEAWPKMARLSREVVITEKIDGTNAQVLVLPYSEAANIPGGSNPLWSGGEPGNHLAIFAGSRTRIVAPDNDNFGFAAWVRDNAEELVKLGPGRHFGEWWGRGIQRQYGKKDRTFSLFDTTRWGDSAQAGTNASRPACCSVVPELYRGQFDTVVIDAFVDSLRKHGSLAAPGFENPEGVIVWHTAANLGFKKTLVGDHAHKGQQ